MKKRQSAKTSVKNSGNNKKNNNKIHWNWIFKTVFMTVGVVGTIMIVGATIFFVWFAKNVRY